MCIVYDDVEYHYGMHVAKPTENGFKHFDIMTTMHAENRPYRYGSICLDNGYEVCTDKNTKPEALIHLLERTVADILAFEKEYARRRPGEPFRPLGNVREKSPDVYENFSEKMKDARPLKEYENIHENLKPFLEKPRYDPAPGKARASGQDCGTKLLNRVNAEWPVEVIYDCKEMYLTLLFAKRNETLKDCEITYARV